MKRDIKDFVSQKRRSTNSNKLTGFLDAQNEFIRDVCEGNISNQI
jgi:hypothetical protein